MPIRERSELDDWRSSQSRTASGSIDSEQSVRAPHTVVPATSDGARTLGHGYWLEVGRASRGIVRSRDAGEGIDLRLLGRGPRLLRFGPPEISLESDRIECAYPILGGLLAQRPGGALKLSQTGSEQPELRLAVSGFLPRLGIRPGFPRWSGALYDRVQHHVHVAISRSYFVRLIAESAQ